MGAHLLGPRQWTPYSKAKYLYELSKKHSLSDIIDVVGGEERDILQSISAFRKMRDHFKPLFTENETFRQDRYSGFKTLEESPKLKETLVKKGYDTDDFAKWLKEGKFATMTQVRSLASVLNHEKARHVFEAKGMTEALKHIDRPTDDKSLQEATISQLCQILREKVRTVSHAYAKELEQDQDHGDLRYMVEATMELASFLEDIGVDVDRLIADAR